MDRRTNTPIEGVIEWLAAQPWWMNLVIACGAYLGFNALSVAPPDAGLGARLLYGIAGLAQYALPGFCLIGGVKSLFARQHREQLVHNVTRSGAQQHYRQRPCPPAPARQDLHQSHDVLPSDG